jgi:hypothetical protein
MHLNTLPRVIPLSLLRAPIFWFRFEEEAMKEKKAAMAREWDEEEITFAVIPSGEKFIICSNNSRKHATQ